MDDICRGFIVFMSYSFMSSSSMGFRDERLYIDQLSYLYKLIRLKCLNVRINEVKFWSRSGDKE